MRALRLQFYPMTFMACLIGSLAASGGVSALDAARFWWGYAALFLLEVATVFWNERFDRESDRRNANPGTGPMTVTLAAAAPIPSKRSGGVSAWS